MPQKHLDLCAGIGGFSLASSWLSYQAIGFCEIDPWCQRVLAKNFPGVPIHDDIRTLTGDIVRGWIETNQDDVADAERWGRYVQRVQAPGAVRDAATPEGRGGNQSSGAIVDRGADGPALSLLTAGYPCQPFSHAGKRLGAADDRHLWPEITRLVDDLRPRWCLFENVAGHVSMGLDDVLSDLENLGYTWGAAVIPAAAVGAPHRRDRVWILANSQSERTGEPNDEANAIARSGQAREIPRVGSDGIGAADVAHTADGGIRRGSASGQTGLLAFSGKDAADAARGRRETGQQHDDARQPDAERCSGWEAIGGLGEQNDGLSRWMAGSLSAFGPDWEDGVPRTTDHESDHTNKLKALGNSIVPQIAYVILLAIQEAA